MNASTWKVGDLAFIERMPALLAGQMDETQMEAAAKVTAGPRGGVKGPFVALLRSPELMDGLQEVGQYLRFRSSLESRITEFVVLIVAREWIQQFEWCTHVPLARKSGLSEAVIVDLRDGRRPSAMQPDEEAVYDLLDELSRTKGVSDATYDMVVKLFGERGAIDVLGVAGYFTAISMVMNVVHTPPPPGTTVALLAPFPR
jgi:4-carboxymuconolactone decarboxylase